MPRKCCVSNCRSNYRGSPYTTAFRFPKIEILKQLWIKKLQRSNFTPKEDSVVCIHHFKESDIIRSDAVSGDDLHKSAPKLKKYAVPSIFKDLRTTNLAEGRNSPDSSYEQDRMNSNRLDNRYISTFVTNYEMPPENTRNIIVKNPILEGVLDTPLKWNDAGYCPTEELCDTSNDSVGEYSKEQTNMSQRSSSTQGNGQKGRREKTIKLAERSPEYALPLRSKTISVEQVYSTLLSESAKENKDESIHKYLHGANHDEVIYKLRNRSLQGLTKDQQPTQYNSSSNEYGNFEERGQPNVQQGTTALCITNLLDKQHSNGRKAERTLDFRPCKQDHMYPSHHENTSQYYGTPNMLIETHVTAHPNSVLRLSPPLEPLDLKVHNGGALNYSKKRDSTSEASILPNERAQQSHLKQILKLPPVLKVPNMPVMHTDELYSTKRNERPYAHQSPEKYYAYRKESQFLQHELFLPEEQALNLSAKAVFLKQTSQFMPRNRPYPDPKSLSGSIEIIQKRDQKLLCSQPQIVYRPQPIRPEALVRPVSPEEVSRAQPGRTIQAQYLTDEKMNGWNTIDLVSSSNSQNLPLHSVIKEVKGIRNDNVIVALLEREGNYMVPPVKVMST